jgi:hypothetical protein
MATNTSQTPQSLIDLDEDVGGLEPPLPWVVSQPKLKRKLSRTSVGVSPIADRTWDTSGAPD